MSIEKYKDIIGLPHHTSPTRPRMSQSDRAAQFAPFAALTGYDAMVEETARLTDAEDAYNEESTALLDKKLRMLSELEFEHPYVEITYFIPDERKSGGRYETVFGHLKLIDKIEGAITLTDKRKILFDRIRDIDSTAFNEVSFE
ncbi:MAG: hypothetical protein IKJ24_01785 [Clostridia bacterium]|nr:hypothetical protein [Clostridia bacterium]